METNFLTVFINKFLEYKICIQIHLLMSGLYKQTKNKRNCSDLSRFGIFYSMVFLSVTALSAEDFSAGNISSSHSLFNLVKANFVSVILGFLAVSGGIFALSINFIAYRVSRRFSKEISDAIAHATREARDRAENVFTNELDKSRIALTNNLEIMLTDLKNESMDQKNDVIAEIQAFSQKAIAEETKYIKIRRDKSQVMIQLKTLLPEKLINIEISDSRKELIRACVLKISHFKDLYPALQLTGNDCVALAKSSVVLQDFAQGKTWLMNAEKNGYDNQEFELLRGLVLLGSKDYPEAIHEFSKLSDHNPDDFLAKYLIGLAYEGKGQYDEASKIFSGLCLRILK